MAAFRVDFRENKCDSFEHFSEYFNKMNNEISQLNLNQAQTNFIYSTFDNLCGASFELIRKLCSENINQPLNMIQNAEFYVRDQIKKHSTVYKRNLMYEKNCITPVEKAIGFGWKSKFSIEENAVTHKFKQNTFQYVPILKTLESLFSNRNFSDAAMENKHICSPGVFERFCCGDIYRNCPLFKENPKAIQLLLAIDDFEPCEATKSKAGIHKICGIYMQVLNLPKKFLSKLENIYLVAICCSTYLNQEYAGLDDIIKLIVADIRKLESVGIKIGSHTYKGTLACFTFDNLGGNDLFGFVKSFNASYYCRICNLSSEECSNAVAEIPQSIRKIDDYSDDLNESQICGKHVKGIKKSCSLNELKYFHMLKNKTVDLMHDVMEGAIPFLLHEVFSFCIKKKILKKDKIIDRVRDFNYGILCQSSKPSFLDIDKTKLNQSACQNYCLMVNLPFILFDVKDKLNEIWICVQSMLQIMQIVFSDCIHENDLKCLEELVEIHLKSFKEKFNAKLKPKHHFLTHYPSVIRLLGPTKNYWMMRMEAKHKFFTDCVNKGRNFKNISKTLATKHQQMMSHKSLKYEDLLEESHRMILKDSKLIKQSIELIGDANPVLYNMKFIKLNGIEYRNGFMLTKDKQFFEIKNIIIDGKGSIVFACFAHKVKFFNFSCNSYEIEKEESVSEPILISLNSLENKMCYEKISCKNYIFIKAETLDLRIKDYL